MKFRKHFDYDVEAASNEAVVDPATFGESLTVQSMSEDADINVMMKRFGLGVPLPTNPRVPMYGDFSEVTDFRSAMEAVLNAQAAFSEYPAEIRARFNNDPQEMLAFVEDGRNIEEARAMGLLKEIDNGREGFRSASGRGNSDVQTVPGGQGQPGGAQGAPAAPSSGGAGTSVGGSQNASGGSASR